MNYEMLTGPYAGEVVEEGPILGGWETLDQDMQQRCMGWAKDNNKLIESAELDALVESWENSWGSQETDKPVTLQTPIVFEE